MSSQLTVWDTSLGLQKFSSARFYQERYGKIILLYQNYPFTVTVVTLPDTNLVLVYDIILQVFQPEGLILGHPLKDGYDSHMSPCKKELVMFHSERILPCYIVHYSTVGGEFKYKV